MELSKKISYPFFGEVFYHIQLGANGQFAILLTDWSFLLNGWIKDTHLAGAKSGRLGRQVQFVWGIFKNLNKT